MRQLVKIAAALTLIVPLAACEEAQHTSDELTGKNPKLPPPNPSLIPTLKVAKAVGWPEGKTPAAARGMAVNAFASDLDHPRWMLVLPNGDVLVAETNSPPREPKGIKGRIQHWFMERAGARVPSANRITLLRDADGDGTAEVKTPFLEGLSSPFGMALVGDRLYVANADALVRFPYKEGEQKITAPADKVADLPAGSTTTGPRASSPAPTAPSSMSASAPTAMSARTAWRRRRTAPPMLEIDPATGASRVFASGLRNPVGIDWNPVTKQLWVAVNERDEIGSDLVPDYMTSVKDGGFYGWPYSYYGQNVDNRVEPQRPDLVAKAIVPDYALGPHTASLGLAFYTGTALPERYRGGAFIGQHGSWNRNPPSGYKVVFLPFKDGQPDGKLEDVLTGFLNEMARRKAGRSAWRSPRAARCWSPTMSAM